MALCKPMLFSGPMVRAILEDRKTQTRRILKPQPGGHIYAIKRELHPFAPSTFKGTPAEGTLIATEKEVWITEDWCQNVIGVWCNEAPHPAGSRIWVKEAHALKDCSPHGYPQCRISYHADSSSMLASPAPDEPLEAIAYEAPLRWRPSIFLPRWASRITLEVTKVRVQRLQDISEEDAIAEGLFRCTTDGWKTWKWGIPRRDGMPGTEDDAWPWHEWEKDPRDAYCKLWESINGSGSWNLNPCVWVYTFKRIGNSVKNYER